MYIFARLLSRGKRRKSNRCTRSPRIGQWDRDTSRLEIKGTVWVVLNWMGPFACYQAADLSPLSVNLPLN